MGKKHKIYQIPTVKFKSSETKCTSATALNIQEQKEKFLIHGKTPMFVVEGDTSSVDELTAKAKGQIRFELLGEAEYILKQVKDRFEVGENYLEFAYGPYIDQGAANECLKDYIKENSLQESLSVYWSSTMTCSARMVWKGLEVKYNRPEMRCYSLWLNSTKENPYLRKYGMCCLLDHEIGTHFFRMYNDGLQPWFSDRKRFGLRSVSCRESSCTEEGLAAINTALRAKEHYLWLSALVYYTACKSTEMTFKQLYDHLGQYVSNPEQRWKHVMRVKRGLVDPNDLGGYGKDQCYFEGAVNILRNVENIDFAVLMSGKICYDEVARVKRIVRMEACRLPAFMHKMSEYQEKLKKMAALNGLHLFHLARRPSSKYLMCLQQRMEGTQPQHKKVKNKRKVHPRLSSLSKEISVSMQNCSIDDSLMQDADDCEVDSKDEGTDPFSSESHDSIRNNNYMVFADVFLSEVILMHGDKKWKINEKSSIPVQSFKSSLKAQSSPNHNKKKGTKSKVLKMPSVKKKTGKKLPEEIKMGIAESSNWTHLRAFSSPDMGLKSRLISRKVPSSAPQSQTKSPAKISALQEFVPPQPQNNRHSSHKKKH